MFVIYVEAIIYLLLYNMHDCTFKVTLMQIWKFHYMLDSLWKQYPENLAVSILRILKLFSRKVCIFLKKQTTFLNIFYCFCMFVNKHFIHLGCAYISKSKQCYNKKPSAYYFHVMTNILVDFHVSVSLALRLSSVLLVLFGSSAHFNHE